VIAGDFNRDGRLDLATSNARFNDVSVLLGNGDGTFQAPTLLPTGTFPAGLATADLNGDGLTDGDGTATDPDTVSSSATGLVAVKNLHSSVFVDGVAATAANHITYCLVESVAPAKYERLTAAVPFEITDANLDDQAGISSANVYNVLKNAAFDLPFTGGTGLALIIGLGVVLAGAGATLVVVNRRRSRTAAAVASL
jgi:hypothetical protein